MDVKLKQYAKQRNKHFCKTILKQKENNNTYIYIAHATNLSTQKATNTQTRTHTQHTRKHSPKQKNKTHQTRIQNKKMTRTNNNEHTQTECYLNIMKYKCVITKHKQTSTHTITHNNNKATHKKEQQA